jgi:hypothetical protein
MTAVISGTNGLLQSYDYQALTTGFTYTFAAGTQVLVMNPAGTLATGTITMPASPADGMTITVESTQQVTAVTVSANTGQSIVGAAVQLIPNQPLSWVYRLTNTTWYPLFGGAGRATSLASGTSQASTSGTSIDFTSIPSWVKRITVMFSGVSTNGTSLVQVQIGSTTVSTSGYASSSASVFGSNTCNTAQVTSGFVIGYQNSASSIRHGAMTLFLLASNTWVCSGVIGTSFASDGPTMIGGSSPALGGALDRVRITTVNGTDTFDAGSINILYE